MLRFFFFLPLVFFLGCDNFGEGTETSISTKPNTAYTQPTTTYTHPITYSKSSNTPKPANTSPSQPTTTYTLPTTSSQCCNAKTFDRETFLNNSSGVYRRVISTNEEGSREFVVVVEKQFYKRSQEILLSIQLKVNGQSIRNFGYRIPKNLSKSSSGKILIPWSWKITSFSSEGGNRLFVYIKNTEYFPADAVFKVVNKQGKAFFALKELTLWKTGFTPPLFKKKYRLTF